MANDITITVSATDYVYTEVVGAKPGTVLRGDLTNGTNSAPRYLEAGFQPGTAKRADQSLLKLSFSEVDPDDDTIVANYGLHIVGRRPRNSFVSDAEMLLVRDQLFEYLSDNTTFIQWLKGKL